MRRSRKRKMGALHAQQQKRTGTWYGVDIGSGGWRMAKFTPDSKEPELILMGHEQGLGGATEKSHNYYPYVEFRSPSTDTEKPKWRFLGYEAIAHPERTSSGLKQSLDPKRLCQPGTQGARFLALCEEDGLVNLDIFRDALVLLLGFVDDNPARINFAVPAIWARGKRGIKIQRTFLDCVADAGYVNVGVDTEQGAMAAYLAWSETGNGEASRTVFTLDLGSGTLDGGHYLLKNGRALLLAPPIGCGGGIDDVKTSLRKKCHKLSPNNESLYEKALRYLYRLPEVDNHEIDGFEFDGHRIAKVEFQDLIDHCYGEGFKQIKEGICKADELDEVIVSGGAPTSNKRLETMLRCLLQDCNDEREYRFEVRFLEPQVAKYAVCKGAAIPYTLDRRAEFDAHAFGILYQAGEGATPSILELKKPASTTMVAGWVGVRLSTDPKKFIIVPHTIGPEVKVVGEDMELGLILYSQDGARPMRRQVFDLSGRRKEGDNIWIRFERDKANSMLLILQIHCDDRGSVIKRRLRLDIDRDGLFVRRVGQRGCELSDIDEETDEMETDDETDNGHDKNVAGRRKANQRVATKTGTGQTRKGGIERGSLRTSRVTRRSQRQADEGEVVSEADKQAVQQLVRESLTFGQQGQTESPRTIDPDQFPSSGQNRPPGVPARQLLPDRARRRMAKDNELADGVATMGGSSPKTTGTKAGDPSASKATNDLETILQEMDPQSRSSHVEIRRAISVPPTTPKTMSNIASTPTTHNAMLIRNILQQSQ